ncbi:MAG: hypothetical protein ACYCZR_09820 [Burkholderiales bacterium]
MKKEAKLAVIAKLKREQDLIRYKLRANRGSMKSLAEEQTRLKRELSVMQGLIRGITE